jgi:hypothetical protein
MRQDPRASDRYLRRGVLTVIANSQQPSWIVRRPACPSDEGETNDALRVEADGLIGRRVAESPCKVTII